MTCNICILFMAVSHASPAAWSQRLKSTADFWQPNEAFVLRPAVRHAVPSHTLSGAQLREPTETEAAITISSSVRVQAPSMSERWLEGIVVTFDENACVLNDGE